jgi:hypothetical protein
MSHLASASRMWTQRWQGMFSSFGLLWHECGQDFAFFCYRIGCGALTVAHSRALELAPVSLRLAKTAPRKTAACSKQSFIFSDRCMTPRASKN